MKPDVRVLGVDDAPFDFDDESVLTVGTVMRGPTYLEAVLTTEVTVDGTDATDRLAEAIGASRQRPTLHAVLLDGIALGGFNVVDLERLHEAVGVPVVTVTRDRPDLDAMRSTLEDKFDDGEARWRLVERGELFPVPTDHDPVHVKAVGIDEAATAELVAAFTVRGRIPEPIRVAHLIAAGVVRGRSRGRP